ncbi:MAG: hypothetical protein QM640_03030 [Niabella sp.]
MKNLVICLMMLAAMADCVGQTGFEQLRNVIPPSPNASSIAKYGSWPVSLYTGVPNINIPVYELKGRSINVPISLSYHASGNKVGEVASWVGLGWALQAGGVITRSIKGLPDNNMLFDNGVARTDTNDISTSLGSSATAYNQLIVASAKSESDTQEDLYTFSALGRSYKLLIRADGSIMTMPYSNIKVTVNPLIGSHASGDTWVVLLEDGTKLVFGGGNNYIEFTSVADLGGVASTWYLNSITSATGETINFSYAMGSGSIEQDFYISHSDYIEYRTSTSQGSLATCARFNQASTSSRQGVQDVTALNLASIESDLARVDFITDTAERLDLKGGLRLSEIKVFSKLENTYVEDYQLKTSYATAVSGNIMTGGSTNTSYWKYRLHLDTLIRADLLNPSAPAQKWYFTYNPQNLPSRRSYAQDHWGFFNGATGNTTFLPPTYYSLPSSFFLGFGVDTTNVAYGFTPSNHVLGAKRWADSSYMTAEMLTAIHYPTGGYTLFNYEPNSVVTTGERFTAGSASLSLELNSGTHSPTSQSVTITVTKPQYVSLNFSSTIGSGILTDFPGAKVSVSITNSAGHAVISATAVNSSSLVYYDLRSAGTYTIKLSTNVDSSEFTYSATYIEAFCTLGYQKSLGTQTYNRYVGGVRIKSIMDNDGTSSNINARYFQYASPLVINPLDTVNDYLTTIYRQTHNSSTGEECYYTRIYRNTSSKFSLGSIEGGTVGYSKVTTLYGADGSNGSTVSIFNSEPDDLLEESLKFPYPASDSREWRRGLLLEQSDYDNNNRLLKRQKESYSFIKKGKVVGLKAGYSTMEDAYFCLDPYQYCGITYMLCYTTAEQVKHVSTITRSYNKTTGDSATNAVYYYYDDTLNTQPTRTLTFNSRGDSIVTYSRTALEKAAINSSITLTSAASTAVDSMVARNIVAVPLESERYVKGMLVNKLLNNYKNWSSSLTLPQNVMLQNASNPVETRLQFDAYDAYGNILQQHKVNDVSHAYLWGYNNTYPIAEAINAGSSEIYATSFEEGGWDANMSYSTTHVHGGDKAGYINKATSGELYSHATRHCAVNLTAAKKFHYSGWIYSGGPSTQIFLYAKSTSGTISTDYVASSATGKWTLLEKDYTVPAGTAEIWLRVDNNGGGQVWFDDLRLHPADAQMTTYTYKPLVGMSSKSDAANRITYYEYDGFGRLSVVKDQDGNIIKTYCYNYAGQLTDCRTP